MRNILGNSKYKFIIIIADELFILLRRVDVPGKYSFYPPTKGVPIDLIRISCARIEFLCLCLDRSVTVVTSKW